MFVQNIFEISNKKGSKAMIKGVNKQIIEINDIENEHFYKAILFVRPESSPRSEEYLNKQANEYITLTEGNIKSAPIGYLRNKQSRNKRKLITTAIISAAALVIVSCLLLCM